MIVKNIMILLNSGQKCEITCHACSDFWKCYLYMYILYKRMLLQFEMQGCLLHSSQFRHNLIKSKHCKNDSIHGFGIINVDSQ